MTKGLTKTPAQGTTPEGTGSEAEAARWVRGMFGRVAHRYDLANHVLSLNLDRHWRARTVRRTRHIIRRPGARVLDLCCGTGDLMIALEVDRKAAVFGSDFCHPMLTAASAKVRERHYRSEVFEADALNLPLPDCCLDVITVAFGFRNLANYRKGLAEMLRVLRPGGMAAILEFSQPPNPLFGWVYGFYSRHILPVIGGLLSGAKDAYVYLPESVSKFPDAGQLAEEMRESGFIQVKYELLTGGIAALHLGSKG